MKRRINICNIPVDNFTMRETVDMIDKAIMDNRQIHHVVVNAAKVVNAQNDEELRKSIVECDIINADGISVVWAARFLGKPIQERVAGIDLMQNLVELAYQKGYKIFFLGAKEEIVREVVRVYAERYSPDIIGGYRNGYFKKEEEQQVVDQITASRAQILFVAMSSPKKEIFLNTYKNELNIPFIMGVGGSFDVVSGLVKRAPRWVQSVGMEWFYRLAQEPRRMWKRYLFGNSKFIQLILKEKFRMAR